MWGLRSCCFSFHPNPDFQRGKNGSVTRPRWARRALNGSEAAERKKWEFWESGEGIFGFVLELPQLGGLSRESRSRFVSCGVRKSSENSWDGSLESLSASREKKNLGMAGRRGENLAGMRLWWGDNPGSASQEYSQEYQWQSQHFLSQGRGFQVVTGIWDSKWSQESGSSCRIHCVGSHL